MKAEYLEGARAKKNFEQGMKALFKVPKAAVARQKKKSKAASVRTTKHSDRS